MLASEYLEIFEEHPAVLIGFVTAFGLFFGSFLNVVIYRLPRRCLSINNPKRSFCPNCKHQLAAIDNLPVISWVVLRAKCRYCKLPISWRYPLIELLTGALFGFTAWRTLLESNTLQDGGAWLTCLTILAMVFVLIPIALIDYDLTIIPDELSLGSLLVFIPLSAHPGAVKMGLTTQLEPLLFNAQNWPLWQNSLLSALATGAAAAAILYAFGFLGKILFAKRAAEMGGEAMGFGDVKLMFLLGIMLGWPKLLVGFFIAVLLGSSIGLTLRFTRKQVAVPFGPFLVIGTLAAMLFAKEISILVDMYLKMLAPPGEF